MLASGRGRAEGVAVDVEIFGCGFQISGQIRTGQFSRLSDWINMQTGFIQVHDAWYAISARAARPIRTSGRARSGFDSTGGARGRTVARAASPPRRPGGAEGAPQGLHRHAGLQPAGQHPHPRLWLDEPIPRIARHPVHADDGPHGRWLDNPAMAARFPFAMINRGAAGHGPRPDAALHRRHGHSP